MSYTVQPFDSDLDAIAALVTTPFGRALLASSDLAELRAILGPSGTPGAGTYLRGDGTWATPPTSGGGAVSSVNGHIGDVNLTASDVGADASGAAAAAQAASQPVDSDLTAIAALATTSFGRSILTAANAAALRTLAALGTAATANTGDFDAAGAAAAAQAASQPVDSDLTAIAALTTTSTGRSLLAAADAAAIRTIASAQASDAELTAIAGLTSAADKLPFFTGSGTASLADLGSFARSVIANTTASSWRSALGLVIGTDVQAFDSDLASIAALTTTTYGRSLLTGADAAATRTTLALGTAATVDTGTTSGTVPLLGASGTLAVARLATGTPTGTKFVRDDGVLATPPGSSGANIATDTIFDAKGDLTPGTGADTAAKLTVGANDTLLIADSTQTTGLRWATPASVRTALGLVIGTNVQAFDAELAALAGLTSAADALPYFTGSGTASTTTLTTYGRSLIDDADAATARTTLGLVIGTNVQAFDSDLANIAALTTTSYGRSLLTNADAAATRTYLGLAIGTDVQALDADLTAIAALTTTTYGRSLLTLADAAALRTTAGLVIGTDVLAYSATTAYTRTLLDDADAATARTTLGAASDATVTAHISETDPYAHTALKVSYSGTVAASDVQGALDTLDSSKPTTTAIVPSLVALGTTATKFEGLELFTALATQATSNTLISGTKTIALLSGTGSQVAPGTDTDGAGTSTSQYAVCSTGTATTGRGGLFMYPTQTFQSASSTFSAGCRLNVPVLSDGTQTFEIRFGFLNTTAATAPSNAIFFRLLNSDTNWKAVTSNAGTPTVTDSGVAASTSAYVNLKISYAAGGNAVFSLNGTQFASHSTNKPANGSVLTPVVQIVKSAGTTSRDVGVYTFRLTAGFDSNLEQL